MLTTCQLCTCVFFMILDAKQNILVLGNSG